MVGMEYAGEIGADAANISLGVINAAQEAGGANGAYRRMYESVANRARRNGTLLVGSGSLTEAMACTRAGQPTVTSDVRNCFRPRAP